MSAELTAEQRVKLLYNEIARTSKVEPGIRDYYIREFTAAIRAAEAQARAAGFAQARAAAGQAVAEAIARGEAAIPLTRRGKDERNFALVVLRSCARAIAALRPPEGCGK